MGALNPGCWITRDFLGLGNINQHVLSQRYPSQHQDLAPVNCLKVLILDTSCQTTSKIGTQPYSSASRLPEVIVSPQKPQNTPSNTALTIRRKRLRTPTRTQALVPPTRKTTQAPGPNLPSSGQRTEARRTTTLQPVEKRP